MLAYNALDKIKEDVSGGAAPNSRANDKPRSSEITEDSHPGLTKFTKDKEMKE